MTEEEIKALKDSNAAMEAKNKELLEEKKKEKDRADKLAQEKTDAEAIALKEKGDFKTLVEKYENDLKIERDAKKASEDRRVSEIKKGAFSLELDKLGIIPERKAFILASVNVEALQYVESSNVVLGAEIKAKEIQSSMPEIFGKKNNNLPNGGSGSAGDPSYMSDDWYDKLSAQDKDKYYVEFMATKGITIKK